MQFPMWVLSLFLLFAPGSANSNYLEYDLSGVFIMETFPQDNLGNVQIWHIELRHGIDYGKPRFTDFTLVTIDVGTFARDKYRIRGMYSFKHPGGPLNRSGRILDFELVGISGKMKVMVEFREDGSLEDIRAAGTNPLTSRDLTFRLVKEDREVRVFADNYEYMHLHKR